MDMASKQAHKPRPSPLNLNPTNQQPPAMRYATDHRPKRSIQPRYNVPAIWPGLQTDYPLDTELPCYMVHFLNHKLISSEGVTTWNAIVDSFLKERVVNCAGERRRHNSCPSRIACSHSLPSTPPASPAISAPNEADVGEKRASLLDLPEHIITQIISLLPLRDVMLHVRKTCTRLRDITSLPYMWKRFVIFYRDSIYNKDFDYFDGLGFSALLELRISTFPVRGLGHDLVRRDEDDCGSAVLVRGRREGGEDDAEKTAVLNTEGGEDGSEKTAVLNREGCEHGAQKSAVLNREGCEHSSEENAVELNRQVAKDEGDAGHGSNSADEETSWVECVETDRRSVVRFVREHDLDLSPRLTPLSIVNGTLYPSLQELSLNTEFFPDPTFLSRHTGLRSLVVFTTAPWWAPGYPMDNIRKMFHELRPCRKLESLKIHMYPGRMLASERIFRTVGMWPALLGYFASGPVLRQLMLDVPVDDVIVSSILDNCPQLQELRLFSKRLTIGAFDNLLENPNTSITWLYLSCYFTDPRLVYVISKAFHGLSDLWLTMRTPKAVLNSPEDLLTWQQAIDTLLLPQAFPKLSVLKVFLDKSVNIKKTEFRTDDPLFCLNSPQPVKGKLVEMTFTDRTKQFPFKFDRACSAHPQLKALNIEGTPRQFFADQAEVSWAMTWSKLKEIFHSPGQCELWKKIGTAIRDALPDLEGLPCPVIQAPIDQPEGSVSDPREDPQNELIAIQWHDNSSDGNLLYMPRPFAHLTKLNIRKCPTLSDQDVLAILLSCPRLEHLWLHCRPPTGPSLLTEKTLHNVLEFGTQLRYVMIPHRMKLSSPDSLARLLIHAPSLVSISINAAHYEDASFMTALLRVWSRETHSLRATKAELEKRHVAVRTRRLMKRFKEKETGIVCFSVRKEAAEGDDHMIYIDEPSKLNKRAKNTLPVQ